MRALIALLAFMLVGSATARASETTSYIYDAQGRLVKVSHSGAVNNGATSCYSLDKADNRTSVDVKANTECTFSGGGGGGSNLPPIANPDTASTTACGTVTKNVVANDTDPDGNYPLHIAGIVSATKGSVDSFTTTSITYTANVNSGTGVVTYTVADSLGATANGTLTITISGGVCP